MGGASTEPEKTLEERFHAELPELLKKEHDNWALVVEGQRTQCWQSGYTAHIIGRHSSKRFYVGHIVEPPQQKFAHYPKPIRYLLLLF